MSIKKHISSLISRITNRIAFIYGWNDPKWMAEYLYKRDFNRCINWDNPTEFNEKIRWMQFYSDTADWITLADKYKVRQYLTDAGYGILLPKLYGVWDNSSSIDFSILPKQFVLKTNHGCGEVLIVNDKDTIDEKEVKKKMNYYLNKSYGHESAEPHYLKIEPYIIAEELIPNVADYSSSIVDYKFYCFAGEPLICGVFYNRNIAKHEVCSSFYDMTWNLHEEWRNPNKEMRCLQIPKPKQFDKMKEICESLSREFPFVRLDFYITNEKIYFGEFTFTPAGCGGGSLNPSLFIELGNKIDLSKIRKIKNN